MDIIIKYLTCGMWLLVLMLQPIIFIGYGVFILCGVLLKRIYFQNTKWRWYLVGLLSPVIIAYIIITITAEDTQYAPNYSERRFRTIKIGMTSQEVYQCLGAPLTAYLILDEVYGKGRFHHLSTEGERTNFLDIDKANIPQQFIEKIYWHYTKQGDPSADYFMRFIVFSAKGNVVEIRKEYYPD